VSRRRFGLGGISPLTAAALLPLGPLVGLSLALVGQRLHSPGVVLLALLALGLLTPGLLLLAVRAWLRATFGLEARALGLEPREAVLGGLGAPILVRGRVNGREVRVHRDRIEVEVVAGRVGGAPTLLLLREQLAQIARGEWARFAPLAGPAERLVRAGVTRIQCDGTRALAWGPGLVALEVLDPALALVEGFAPLRVRPRAGEEGCPYCHAAVGGPAVEAAVRCPACDVRQHAECWREHGGCAVHGCARGPAAAAPLAERLARRERA
jgi:hypothetical protein